MKAKDIILDYKINYFICRGGEPLLVAGAFLKSSFVYSGLGNRCPTPRCGRIYISKGSLIRHIRFDENIYFLQMQTIDLG